MLLLERDARLICWELLSISICKIYRDKEDWERIWPRHTKIQIK